MTDQVWLDRHTPLNREADLGMYISDIRLLKTLRNSSSPPYIPTACLSLVSSLSSLLKPNLLNCQSSSNSRHQFHLQNLNTFPRFFDEHTRSPCWPTNERTMASIDLDDIINLMRSTRFSRVNKILRSHYCARHICSANDVCCRYVTPSRMCRGAPESSKALGLQVFGQFHDIFILHVLVEHSLDVFWSYRDGSGLQSRSVDSYHYHVLRFHLEVGLHLRNHVLPGAVRRVLKPLWHEKCDDIYKSHNATL
jgi:hypothetical protein